MTDDAILSDFASETSDEDSAMEASRADSDASSTDGEAASGDSETVAQTADTDDAPEATPSDETGLSTYAWGEYTCSQCAATTDRVWRADGSLVCPDCKEW
ncbi:hypothetical protein [Natrinema sp. SYSU A 869]|uniref:DUF7573 domain-containing protein n=1 Tax=Natrinema sp. SYSU A 869 TaxID=2871694 RepID=UPI001CA40748|nr:hypothetical protein [Natrinema sp. SYSU A 869]